MIEAELTRVRRLAALFQLASPMLPVGAYAYSQGIERCVHDGWIRTAADAQDWILDALAGPFARFEGPVLLRLHRAVLRNDDRAFADWNERFVASRETCELRAETLQMGGSLATWAADVNLACGPALRVHASLSFPAAFAACCCTLSIGEVDALSAYAWSWVENQVAAAMKSVPLGQAAGQRMLLAAHAAIADAVQVALPLQDDDLMSAAPGLALASALHETQYSRLFRS